MPDYVVTADRLAVHSPDSTQARHPIFKKGATVTLTKEQGDRLIRLGSVAEPKAPEPQPAKVEHKGPAAKG